MRKRFKQIGIFLATAAAITVVAIGYIADAAGAVTALFSGPFAKWLNQNSVPAFWLAILAILTLAVVITFQQRRFLKLKAGVGKLETEVAEHKENLQKIRKEYEKAKSAPNKHDVDLFNEFVKDFPPDGKTMDYLADWFSGEKWNWEKLAEVDYFYYTWNPRKYFIDHELNQMLIQLREHSGKFLSNISRFTFKDHPEEEVTALKHDQFENQQSFNRQARLLQKLGDELVSAHTKLVRRALEKGIQVIP